MAAPRTAGVRTQRGGNRCCSGHVLWGMCVACLVQAPPAVSFLLASRCSFVCPSRSAPAVSSRMALETGHDGQEAAARWSLPADGEDKEVWTRDVRAVGGGARRRFKAGEVVQVRPSVDNKWHENRAMLERESTFIHALMYQWPSGWLRAERRLNSLARKLRGEPPPELPLPEGGDSPDDGGTDADLPFDLPPLLYRVDGRAGIVFVVLCCSHRW